MQALPGDYHNHTIWSDGTGTVDDSIRAAIDAGITEVGISDHFGPIAGSPYPGHPIKKIEIPSYLDEVELASTRYDDIMVLLSAEADYSPETEDALSAMLDANRFDYIVGGVHSVCGFDFDNVLERDDPKWLDLESLYHEYYTVVKKSVEFGKLDIIAHLDYIGLWGHKAPKSSRRDVYVVLEAIRESGAALEINTDNISDPAQRMYPERSTIELAAKMGIPITFGSDAHRSTFIGGNFEQAVRVAYECGYNGSRRMSDREIIPFYQK